MVMKERCKNCPHFNAQNDEYDWCHMCRICYKPIINKWIDISYAQWPDNYIRTCSNCGWCILITAVCAQDLKWKYCPNCGVRMESKE